MWIESTALTNISNDDQQLRLVQDQSRELLVSVELTSPANLVENQQLFTKTSYVWSKVTLVRY